MKQTNINEFSTEELKIINNIHKAQKILKFTKMMDMQSHVLSIALALTKKDKTKYEHLFKQVKSRWTAEQI